MQEWRFVQLYIFRIDIKYTIIKRKCILLLHLHPTVYSWFYVVLAGEIFNVEVPIIEVVIALLHFLLNQLEVVFVELMLLLVLILLRLLGKKHRIRLGTILILIDHETKWVLIIGDYWNIPYQVMLTRVILA